MSLVRVYASSILREIATDDRMREEASGTASDTASDGLVLTVARRPDIVVLNRCAVIGTAR